MIMSMLLSIGVFLLLFPSCLLVIGTSKNDLFARIQIEHQLQIHQSFNQRKGSRFFLAVYLQNPERLKQVAKLIGFDLQKMTLCLSRSGWNVSVQDLLLAKILGGVCLAVVAVYTLLRVYMGNSVGYGLLLLITVCILLFLFPTQMVEIADKQAKNEIRQQTPVFFGIVLSLLDAGMPIHSAIRATAKRFSGRLGRELMKLETTERSYGNWRIALEELAFQWDVDELLTIVSDINQSLLKGTTVISMLALHIDEQIRQQEDEATEYMNRISIRLIPFIIVFMGVPLLFLVMGPSFMGIMQEL